uniref:Uncharacterized protein n=1 Tax=Peronospora matthiolae TaxID=2874970 RepID=A0AAV1THU2_9STRA
MTRHPRKQPTPPDINEWLARLSVTKPDASDKCRAGLMEAICRTRRILFRFEKHLDTAQRSDSRKHIKTRLLEHASDLLSFESTESLRITRDYQAHEQNRPSSDYGPPGHKVVLARQQPTAKSNMSLKLGSKVIKRSTNTIATPDSIN